ncbi:MAG TPA: WG repeat-containing protein [Bacteroidia bacterium]
MKKTILPSALTFFISYASVSQSISVKQDEKSNLYGFVDENDNYIVKPTYKEVDFNFGMKPGIFYVVNKNEKYGYVNDRGKEVVPCKYDHASSFDNGYCIVEIKTGEFDRVMGLLDSTGREVVPVKYGQLEFYPKEKVLLVGETSSSDVGLMGLDGKMIIPFQYEFWSKRISNGLWPVGKNDMCGVVNMKNEIIVPFEYEMIENYSDELGLAPAKKGGKFGFIDRTGKVVVPFTYQDAWAGSTALVVKKDGKWGVIGPTGQIILPFEFYNISSVGDKTAWVSKSENEEIWEIDLATKQKVPQK